MMGQRGSETSTFLDRDYVGIVVLSNDFRSKDIFERVRMTIYG
jgi:hypothetical protein